MADVEQVTVESDERGFELHLIVGDDIQHRDDGLIILNIHGVAEQLLSECVTKIGPWLLEGYAAARQHARELKLAAATPFDDDDSGYDLDDPKHPSYRDRMADLADHRRKRDREDGAA